MRSQTFSLYFQIDLDKSLEEQGPFDMILHKFTDILVKAQQGNITAQRIIRSIEVTQISFLDFDVEDSVQNYCNSFTYLSERVTILLP